MPAELQALLAAPWLPRMAALAALTLFVWQNRTLGRPLAAAAWNGAKRVGAAIRSRLPGTPNVGAVQVSGTVLVLLGLSLGSAVYQGGWSWPSLPSLPVITEKATAATYVYENRQGPIPSAVQVGIDRLRRERNITATIFERGTKDGDGEVPDQYKAPLAAAEQSGLPSLVVTAGDKVLKVVKEPTTTEQVMEAVP